MPRSVHWHIGSVVSVLFLPGTVAAAGWGWWAKPYLILAPGLLI